MYFVNMYSVLTNYKMCFKHTTDGVSIIIWHIKRFKKTLGVWNSPKNNKESRSARTGLLSRLTCSHPKWRIFINFSNFYIIFRGHILKTTYFKKMQERKVDFFDPSQWYSPLIGVGISYFLRQRACNKLHVRLA